MPCLNRLNRRSFPSFSHPQPAHPPTPITTTPPKKQGLVELEAVDTEEELALLQSYIQEHVAMTGSTVGQRVLDGWPASAAQFVKVCVGVGCMDWKRERVSHVCRIDRWARFLCGDHQLTDQSSTRSPTHR